MGKSTLSKFVLRQSIVAAEYIPIFVELRRIKSGQKLHDFICDEVLRSTATEPCKNKLIESFKSGGFLFIFDGYDEIDENIRADISSDISRMSAECDKCCFWLTSRPDSRLASFSGFLEYKIRPLEKGSAYNLLRRYDAGRGKADSLISKIDSMDQISEFLGNPLLVTLLYKAYDYKATIPIKRNIFFRQVFEALYQDHDLSKEGTFERRKKSALDADDFHKALRALGIVTFKAGKVQYSTEEFTRHLNDVATLVSPLKLNVGHWRSDLLSAVPIFTKDGTDVRWAHKAFQDYFAAQFVYFDMIPQQKKFLNRILSDPDPQKFENLLMLSAELDIELMRDAYIRDYVKGILEDAERVKATGNEVDFSLYIAMSVGRYFVLTPDFRYNEKPFNFHEFPEFLQYMNENFNDGEPFTQAGVGGIKNYYIISFHRDEKRNKLNLLARLDPENFLQPSFLKEMNNVPIEAFTDQFSTNGLLDLSSLANTNNDITVRMNIAKLISRNATTVMPSLDGLRKLFDDDDLRHRQEKIESLFDGL